MIPTLQEEQLRKVEEASGPSRGPARESVDGFGGVGGVQGAHLLFAHGRSICPWNKKKTGF